MGDYMEEDEEKWSEFEEKIQEILETQRDTYKKVLDLCKSGKEYGLNTMPILMDFIKLLKQRLAKAVDEVFVPPVPPSPPPTPHNRCGNISIVSKIVERGRGYTIEFKDGSKQDFYSGAEACKYLGIYVGGDSAHRVLERCANKNGIKYEVEGIY